jgi:outer membrane receptor protein involved in Fe transport
LLEPFDRGESTPENEPRYIYKNIEAVDNFNNVTINTINVTPSLPGDGVSTPLLGIQQATLQMPPDGVCGLDVAGNLATQRGASPRRPERDWRATPFSRPISDFQGLQETYNDVEYYAYRFQLNYQPTERWNLLGNFHWGENRSDSLHLQSVGVEPAVAFSGQLIEEPLGFFEGSTGWSELDAVRLVPFEGEETRDGLFAQRTGAIKAPGFATDDPFSGFYNSDGDEKLDLRGTSLNSSYELDWGRLLYVGGYEFNRRKIEDEGDASPGTDLEAVYKDETWQVTQDLRLEVEGDGYVLRLGGFFIHEELDSNNLFKATLRNRIDQDFDQETDGWNVGGELHYDFLEEGARPWLYQISLDGGARYNWEQKKFALGSVCIPVNQNGEPVPGRDCPLIDAASSRGIWRETTGEATLSVKPLESLRLYGKYTHGFKAGHFNAGLTVDPNTQEVTQSLDPVAPESIDAFEVGMKWSLLDDRVELSGALFRYFYEDLQVFDIVNEADDLPTQQLLNSDADVLGAEIEASLRPFDGLLLQGGLGWLDSEFGKFLVTKRVESGTPRSGGDGGNATFNYEGNPLIAAPEWSLSGYVEYELPLSRWGSLIPIFDFSYKSQTYLDAQKEELISQEPYWLFNARLVYRTPSGGIEVAGWVQNLQDQEYKTDAFDLSRQFSTVLEVWGEPRTYGVTVSLSL